MLLAFAPSSLMLGVTSYVSMDLSPFPLLWVIPLALYLITFILVFAKWPVVWTGVPHNIILFVQPFFLLGLCLIILRRSFDPYLATMFSFLGFFLTALMCHGELARDRPTPKHLTEFFLLMAVGGALGGLFNALIAPQVFVGVAEYPIAIIAACFLRPRQKDNGWFDELLLSAFPGFQTWVRDSGDQLAQNMGKPAPRSNYLLNYSLDIFFGLFILGLALFLKTNADTSWGWLKNDPSKNGLLKIMKFFGLPNSWHTGLYQIGVYGIPMIFCLFFSFSRPVRFGLAVAMVLLANLVIIGRGEENLIYAGRSYFGVLRVLEDIEGIRDPDIDQAKLNLDAKRPFATYTYLMHGTTYHGRNYQTPTDLRRLATTYYHRKGPVGVIMERYNWFPGKQNTYAADARLPVSMIGLGATPLGGGSLEQLVSVWTEPPYATIGLGSGTMASFGRCFQHVTYYEIDDNIRNFSLPPSERFLWENKADNKGEKKDPYFTYLVDAVGRGSNLEVIMGDARLSMKEERPQVSNLYSLPIEKGAFSTKHNLPGAKVSDFSKREKYYKVIVVDAFSSDAIPIHLITKEAIELYFSKLAEDGVLCVHTSNRHMDLVKPVSDIAKALGKAARVGHDVTKRRDVPPYLGHFGSEYVMLANDEKFLPKEGTIELSENSEQIWETPRPPGMSLWTDDFSNIVSILR